MRARRQNIDSGNAGALLILLLISFRVSVCGVVGMFVCELLFT